jgi:uncharacterized protein
LIKKIDLNKYVNEEVGLPTLLDIAAELEKPARDPRAEFKYARFDAKIQDLKDLQKEMWLEGVVTNVTNFGAFIDIGVHQDGLVHISEMADKFVDDAKKLVTAGQIVQVRVLDVDVEQKRISLSMKKQSAPAAGGEGKKGPKGQGQGGKPGQQYGKGPGGPGKGPKKPHATMDQLKDKFGGDSKQKQNNVKLAFSLKQLMRSGR